MKTRLLILLAIGLLLIGFTNTLMPNVLASENLFYGNSSFERVPSAIVPNNPQTIEIKFQYTDGPYSLSDFKPIIDVSPKEALPYVHVEFEPVNTPVRNSIVRLLGTITVDPEIPSEKIFLNISFVGTSMFNEPISFKSGWFESAIINIRENIACCSLDKTIHQVPFSSFTIIKWDDFGDEFRDDAMIVTENMTQISILEAVKKYYVIQKVDFKAEEFGNKDTKVNATVGFAIQRGDQMIHPPRGENVTDGDHEAFNRNMFALNDAFSKQSTIGNSYDFVVDVENPFYIKFPLVIDESGQYTRQYYKKTHIIEGPTGYGMGGLVVVEKHSKAVSESGGCKKEGFRLLIKHDYSNLVCVQVDDALKLKQYGWALN